MGGSVGLVVSVLAFNSDTIRIQILLNFLNEESKINEKEVGGGSIFKNYTGQDKSDKLISSNAQVPNTE